MIYITGDIHANPERLGMDALAQVDQYDDIWKDDVLDFFDGLEGNY